jgi:hypothetical protein
MTAQQLLTATFTTKEGYLAWRADWRKVYADLTQEIRDLKRDKTYHVGQSRLAHKLMLRRKWSKEEAQVQYLAAKQNPPLVSIC